MATLPFVWLCFPTTHAHANDSVGMPPNRTAANASRLYSPFFFHFQWAYCSRWPVRRNIGTREDQVELPGR